MAQTTVKVYLTGKLGSMVYTPNRQGTAVRSLVTPKNPQTAAQTTQRGRLSAAAKAWGALTSAARLSWKNLISSFPNNLSSFNIFVKNAVTSAECGDTQPTTAPAMPSIGLPVVTAPSAILSAGTGLLALSFTPVLSPAPDHYLYKASAPVGPGVSAQPALDIVAVSTGASPLSASALGAAYVAKFGTPPVGKQIFITAIPVKSGFQGASPEGRFGSGGGRISPTETWQLVNKVPSRGGRASPRAQTFLECSTIKARGGARPPGS